MNAWNGALLWQLPFTTDFDQNAFTPVVFQDLLIVGGIDWPLTAMRLKPNDGKWIAYLASDGGNSDVWVKFLAGGTPRNLTASAGLGIQVLDYVASPLASATTGAALRVEGGLVAPDAGTATIEGRRFLPR